MKTAKKVANVEESSGNVYADLGCLEPEGMLAKAKLAHTICELIAARKLTEPKPAPIIGLDQPKISALMRGKLQGFSLERLFRCLHELGQEVHVVIRPLDAGGRAGVHVGAAPTSNTPVQWLFSKEDNLWYASSGR